MSSLTSRASTSAAEWQQQSISTNGNRTSTSQRPSQSPPTGSKTQYNNAITSYPIHDSGETLGATNTSYLDETSGIAHLDGQTSQSNADFVSNHFPYSNYLTPDHGSDNLFSDPSSHTSPGFDDFPWQQGFAIPDSYPDEYGHDTTLLTGIFSATDQGRDLQGIGAKQAPPQVLNPSSSTPRMSSAAVEPLPSTLPVYIPTAPSTMTSENNKRSRNSEDEDYSQDDRFSRPTSNVQSSNELGNVVPPIEKPTVLISSYNRGDSPARTLLPMARSLSKRSQNSRLSGQGETASAQDPEPNDASASTSRLMPPSHYDDEDWADDEDKGVDRSGVAPTNRNNDTVPSLNDMETQRELDENRVGVENWLATSETGSPTRTGSERNGLRSRHRKERIRSRSTGARTDLPGASNYSDKHIPGPGALLDVDSDLDYTDDGSSYISSDEHAETGPDSPAAEVEIVDPSDKRDIPFLEEDSIPPEAQEPLPRQFIRKGPWQDPVRFEGTIESPGQPHTSNQAIMQYDKQAAKFETASRRATWGTRRRLSDSEISSIIDGDKVRQLSITNKARDRGSSIINRARTVIRRSSSNIKKSRENFARHPSPPNESGKPPFLENEPGHPATSPIQQPQRTFSWSKSKSPPLTATGGALMAMTGQLTAVGGSTVGAGIEHSERPKSPFYHALKRSRSKSDIPKTPKGTPGLSELFNKVGGPPVPTLASPHRAMRIMPVGSAAPTTSAYSASAYTTTAKPDDDEDDEDGDEEMAVRMDLPVQSDNIIPNLDGFRTHAKRLNPRTEPYLIERIAQDQLRRYKKLVKNKIEHTRNVQFKQQCTSGQFCTERGGKPKILPPRTSAKDANVNYAQFKVGAPGDSDGEETGFVEGVVTPALFPSGIPLPPTTHLPAEFECPLCFQVKKFQKPSDWTKHVHEDVQPFSCTFPNCTEPKSFKRKADWVRHENERHRHLEWWKCSIQECAHMCFRKDNFVQHLVREHKMTEPKSKNQRPAGTRARPSRPTQNLGQDAEDFWQLVEHCRHDTSSTPKNEPCKFCGNVCSTWKKLSVHVGKHMEQIAMPVLELAQKRAITADTVISPIEPPNQRMTHAAMLDTTGLNGYNPDALSPYAASNPSMYHSSSAGQSPVPVHSVRNSIDSSGQLFYNQGLMQNGMQQPRSSNFQTMPGRDAGPANFSYPSYEVVNNGQAYTPAPYQNNAAFTQQPVTQGIPASYQPQHVPRSQPMDTGYPALNIDTVQGGVYNHDHYYPNSAPGTTYMGDFGNPMNQPDGLHSPHNTQLGHVHSPASAVQQPSHEYLFAQHHHGPGGAAYY